ncbi:ThiF family adenylyltransferase [Ramlibacter alkalitolerans]
MPSTLLREQALDRLRHDIAARWAGAVELSAQALTARFPKRPKLVAGWRLPGAIQEPPHDLLILLDERTPWSLPLVALPEATGGVSYPHLEADGHLCLTPTGTAYAMPVGVEHIEQLVADAEAVMSGGRTGANDDDFYSEAHSYWTLVEPSRSEVWLAAPAPNEHSLWFASRHGEDWVVGPTRDQLMTWLRWSGRQGGATEPCVVIRVGAPLHPRDYPLSAADLLKFADASGAAALVSSALGRWSAKQSLPVLIVYPHAGKDVLLGGLLPPPGSVRMPGAKHNGVPGFRHVPSRRGSARGTALAAAGGRFAHVRVVPVYRDFLVDRTAGQIPASLQKSHVVVVGCGALGGQLALQLAQAGVGRLSLVDDDVFTWQNVGRHVLDGRSVGKWKAQELAAVIRASFPDISVKTYVAPWDSLKADDWAEVDSADLWVSATGDAASNQHLDELVAAGEVPATVFCWLEPFAVAGHAVLHLAGSSRLRGLTDSAGRMLEPVSDLLSAPPPPKEPSCGAFYQPYSSLASLSTVVLTGELVLDALAGRATVSTHRVWVGSAESFGGNGLQIHPAWHGRLANLGYNRRFDLPVPPTP